ncbi:MAG: SpoIIE family protein phosphatase [Actinomycetes bacterium]
MTIPILSRRPVHGSSQVPVARAAAVEAAWAVGLTAATCDTVALVATELAENLHRHAVDGELWLLPEPAAGADGKLTVLAIDRGPGVVGFHRCLEDGFSTTETMGTGLGAVRRAASRFDAVSEPGRGTVVAAVLRDPRPHPRHGLEPVGDVDVAALGFPAPGEEVSGDAWTCVSRDSRLMVLLADGLGHGQGAADASQRATGVLRDLAHLEPGEVLRALDTALVGTRGAALTLALVEPESLRTGGPVTITGLGNVSALVAGPDGGTRRAATGHGTAGARGRTPYLEHVSDLAAGGVLLLHSDGLTSRWTLDDRLELLQHSAVVIAAALLRDHARGSDDSLVVVVKAGGRYV